MTNQDDKQHGTWNKHLKTESSNAIEVVNNNCRQMQAAWEEGVPNEKDSLKKKDMFCIFEVSIHGCVCVCV